MAVVVVVVVVVVVGEAVVAEVEMYTTHACKLQSLSVASLVKDPCLELYSSMNCVDHLCEHLDPEISYCIYASGR